MSQGEPFEGSQLALTEGDNVNLTLHDSNFELGGMKGESVTQIGLTVENTASAPPTIQSFRTVGTSGTPTTEFATAAEGKAEIYTGIFTIAQSESSVKHYEAATPSDITLEYSAHGLDSWHPLEINADPSHDFMPGWGKYYYASLSGINIPSENGWYDLRLTVKGDKDAFTTQTVSPAVRIDEYSGIDTVETDARLLHTEYHDLNGRTVEPTAKGVLIRTDYYSDGNRSVRKVIQF